MSKAEKVEDLRVWQEAREMVQRIYSETRDLRDFGFRDQICRAAVSVMNNIAEGFERRTDADFAHFLDMAKGSAGEVRSMIYVAEDQGYMTAEFAQKMRTECSQLSGGIATLAAYLRKK